MSFATGRLSPVSAASAVCSAAVLEQARVGRDGVALLDQDDVAGHDLGRRHPVPRAVADDGGVRGRHLAQRRHRLLGARLLDVAHDGVEEHDGEDRHRLVGQAESRSYSHSPTEIAVATSSRMTSTSWNCARNLRQAGTGFSAVSSFRP